MVYEQVRIAIPFQIALDIMFIAEVDPQDSTRVI